jgi:hypothetical protein
MKRLKWLAHAAVVLVLTALTQVGGVIYLVALAARRRLPQNPGVGLIAAFVGLYALAWFPIQSVAALTGRVGLPCAERGALRVATPLYCALHRHYVRRATLRVAQQLAHALNERHPGTLTQTLDAGFPFFDGFPLLPHLSHDDGRRLDLAFYYADAESGHYARGALRSPIGYWAFEQPTPRERQPCRNARGPSLRWDQDWFQPLVRRDLVADRRRLTTALSWLSTEGRALGARRALIEPHLADRMQLDRRFVRFQGCRASRHDDHFHIDVN